MKPEKPLLGLHPCFREIQPRAAIQTRLPAIGFRRVLENELVLSLDLMNRSNFLRFWKLNLQPPIGGAGCSLPCMIRSKGKTIPINDAGWSKIRRRTGCFYGWQFRSARNKADE